MSNIEVSVICLTYNHEKYIKQCLDGFVSQRTNFRFEVLIHDDASTDNTANIIREYEIKYPDIIKPIYQKENQYSKGIGITQNILLPLAKGKYIAFCEGDDCWTHPYKLQKQVEYLERHPDCSICVHNAIWNEISTGKQYYASKGIETKDYSTDEIIEGGGGIFATSSAVVRKKVISEKPKCFYCPGVGDYQMFIFASICGKCHYMIDVMSQYNCGVDGSWTSRVYNNINNRIKHFNQIIEMLNNVNNFYEGKYSTSINKQINKLKRLIRELEYNIAKSRNEKKEMLKKDYREFFNRDYNSLKSKVYFYVSFIFPSLIDEYEKWKR